MKIAFITDYFPPYTKGGAEISTFKLVKELSKSNDCIVITQKFRKNKWSLGRIKIIPLIDSLIQENHNLLYNFFKLIFSPVINYHYINKVIKNENPDLIQTVISNHNLMYVIILSLFSSKPNFIDVRDYAIIKHPSKVLLNRENKKSFKDKAVYIYDKILFKINKKLIIKLINSKKACRIITNSKFMKKQLIAVGYPRKKIVVVSNISEPLKIESKDIKRENRIIFAGRVEKEKGIWDAIKAFELLKNNNLIFDIVGDGYELNNIREYLKQNEIKNINLLGKIPNEKVIELYLKSKAIIAPSIWPEPFGRYILESISTKTPLISTITGGTPEGVRDYETGLLVEPNNPQQLAKAIKELLTNKKLYDQIVKNLEKEAEKYSPEKICKQRMNAYEESINSLNEK